MAKGTTAALLNCVRAAAHTIDAGQKSDDAARHLAWSSGTLIGRLERGRKLLRRRLVKRGVALSAGLLAILGDSASASVSPALIQATLRAARGEVRPAVAALISG